MLIRIVFLKARSVIFSSNRGNEREAETDAVLRSEERSSNLAMHRSITANAPQSTVKKKKRWGKKSKLAP